MLQISKSKFQLLNVFMNKHSISLDITEQVENDAMTLLYLFRNEEVCCNKEDLLQTLEKIYNQTKKFIEAKL